MQTEMQWDLQDYLDRLAAIVLMRTLLHSHGLKCPWQELLLVPGMGRWAQGQFFPTTFCSQTIFREGKQLFPELQ